MFHMFLFHQRKH